MKSKYYIFNKLRDFDYGYNENLVFKEKTGVTMINGNKKSVFYSGVFDSLEKQTVWFKLETDCFVPNNTTMRFTFFAYDKPYVYDKEGNKLDIYKVIKDNKISSEQKDMLFNECSSEVFINPSENIFRNLKGRYLWFKAELMAQQENFPVIKKVKAYIKYKNWIEYLPEIYRIQNESSEFLERYLMIFQNIYERMEIQIDNLDLLFNPDIADREFLEWLSSWISISDVYMWNNEQLRYLLKNAVRLYRNFGTKESISEMIKLYTGEAPVIIENCKLYNGITDEYSKNLYNNLYDSSPFVFTVLIRNECIKSDNQYETLMKIIQNVKPVHMEVNLVILQPVILLDGYSYMGINTELNELKTASLDGKSAIDFTIL